MGSKKCLQDLQVLKRGLSKGFETVEDVQMSADAAHSKELFESSRLRGLPSD